MRRLFSSAYRKARRAEGKGDYREAAALYAELDMPEEAAKALLFFAARASALEERLAAYHDALRWLPEDHPQRVEVDAQIGLAVLDDAQRRGVHTSEEKRRLEDAAQRLERSDKESEAATAFELLGRTDDVARCLQKAGEVERLEALLEETSKASREARALRRYVGEYEMAMSVGARIEARAALEKALDEAPDDRAVPDLLRRLEQRWPSARRVKLRVEEREVVFVGRDEVEVGRDADVVIRGTSVSRRHTSLTREATEIVVRDLGSRNGTLLAGVPIAAELRIKGATDLGLGDDVTLRVEPVKSSMRIEVMGGLDRGQIVFVGSGALRMPRLAATITFPSGHPTITPDAGAKARLGTQSVAAPVNLLAGDTLEIDGTVIEVV